MSQEEQSTACPAIVRDATLADVPGLERCYDQAAHRDRILTADGKTLRYLVVEFNREIVGFGRLATARSPAMPSAEYFPRMSNLNVREDMRRRGFASLLIRTMEDLARGMGHPRIYVGVQRDNRPALALYTKLGYQPIHTAPVQSAAGPHVPGAARRFWVIQMVKPLQTAREDGGTDGTP